MATLTAMPARFTAGETVKYTKAFSDYPANAGNVLKLVMAGVEYTAPANVDGTSFDITLTHTQSALVPAGGYRWLERVTTAGGEVHVLASGYVTVDPDPATLTAEQSLSYAQRTLKVIEAIQTGRLTRDMQAWIVDGVQAQFYDAADPDLEKLRVKMAREVEHEKRGTNPGLGKAHKFAFRGR